MKTIIEFFLYYFFRIAMWFRYSIEIKGFDKINPNVLNKPGGVLFLPNHPSIFVDPIAVTVAIWPKYPIRPLIVEYMYYTPIIHWICTVLDALPIPNFAESSNSYKRKKNEKVMQEVIKGLHQKENFLIFPAGRVKHTAYEAIDGASAVHQLVQDVPEANIVLVRVKGVWGSSFSRALTGQNPKMFKTIFHGILKVLKNLIFFTPRRKVIIEFEPAPADFPYKAGRLEFNKYLERWYNRPDGLTEQTGAYPGDSLVLVSYSMWGEDLPKILETKESIAEDQIHLNKIPVEVQKKVVDRIAELIGGDPKTITPKMVLTTDLGMDSLDIADLVAFLQDQFDVTNVSPNDLTTVGKFMALAAHQVEGEGIKEEELKNISKWKKPIKHHRAEYPIGQTIPEVFLNNCDRMGSAVACADMRSGILTYKQLKMRTLLLAEYIRTLPGEYVGILLPASTAASMLILACQLAGKIPLMVNWTVGARHLQSVVDQSKVKVVLTAWSFIDRLQNVDLNGVDEIMVMLEDVRRNIGLKDKLKALYRSKLSTKSILKIFDVENLSSDKPAVLLFTSGTESMPKGVPLTHNNLLSNQRATLNSFPIYSDDVVFGILPPFHSFGFLITLMTLLGGVKVAFSPDPTDGKRLAQGFALWGVSVVVGAPSFIKGLIKAIQPENLKTMRLCVTGAEKAPAELIHAIDQLGYGKCRYEGYGITECSPVLTFTPQDKPPTGVGQPLSNVELCIVDLNTHAPKAVGEQGLILSRGPNIFSGYLTPGLASPFVTVNSKQWYNTGDLGYIDAEGNLHISGRLKRFIKVGGEMVSLTAIEDALSKKALSSGLAQKEDGPILAISGKEYPGEKPKISLFCKFPISTDEANTALREAGFSNLVKINNVIQLTEIPLMGSGKVHYRKLEETFLKDE